MKALEHLTETQIAGYFAGKFAVAETREIGRHLLLCETCRKQLPRPSENVFLTYLMDEWETENTVSRRLPKFSAPLPLRPSFSALSFSIVLLFFCAGLLYFIFFGSANSDLNAQVNLEGIPLETALFENQPEINADENLPAVQKTPVPLLLKKKSPTTNRKLILPESRNKRSVAIAVTRNGRREGENIASVRGSTNSVRENGAMGAIDTRILVSGASLKLEWLKYPQAAGYSVVITDAATNNLIDEIKLESGTEIEIPLKKFEPSKKYEIRVAAVLPGGIIKTSKTFIYTKNLQNYRRKD